MRHHKKHGELVTVNIWLLLILPQVTTFLFSYTVCINNCILVVILSVVRIVVQARNVLQWCGVDHQVQGLFAMLVVYFGQTGFVSYPLFRLSLHACDLLANILLLKFDIICCMNLWYFIEPWWTWFLVITKCLGLAHCKNCIIWPLGLRKSKL